MICKSKLCEAIQWCKKQAKQPAEDGDSVSARRSRYGNATLLFICVVSVLVPLYAGIPFRAGSGTWNGRLDTHVYPMPPPTLLATTQHKRTTRITTKQLQIFPISSHHKNHIPFARQARPATVGPLAKILSNFGKWTKLPLLLVAPGCPEAHN